ncbi:MAG: DUF998 domain-containing protein [Actinomycetaceae bacterium]|nr:DUF998 domain-containing protein [Actinomycetaceae bacterium]
MRYGRYALAILAFVAYNSWVLWPLNGDPEAILGYLSELAAGDQPYHWLFRGCDLLAASIFAIIALLGWRGWAGWLGRRAPQVAVALLTVAVATVFDVTFNLPCAESRDAVCKATPFAVRHVHEAASVIVGLALVALIGLVAIAFAEQDGRRGRACWVAAFGLLVAALLLASAILPAFLPLTQGPVQAVQVLLCSGWIAYLAVHLSEGRSAAAIRGTPENLGTPANRNTAENSGKPGSDHSSSDNPRMGRP